MAAGVTGKLELADIVAMIDEAAPKNPCGA